MDSADLFRGTCKLRLTQEFEEYSTTAATTIRSRTREGLDTLINNISFGSRDCNGRFDAVPNGGGSSVTVQCPRAERCMNVLQSVQQVSV